MEAILGQRSFDDLFTFPKIEENEIELVTIPAVHVVLAFDRGAFC